MRFKTFLKEMNYGSLIDRDLYDQLDKADQALYKYTADGFTSLDSHIDKLVKRYPYKGGKIYRGLHFDTQEQHDGFLKSIEDGQLKAGGPTSWSPHESTAADFAHSKKTYIPDLSIMMAHEKMRSEGEHMSGYGGVVISTEVGEGVGVDVKQSKFAKESEVILKPGTYNVKIEKLMEPHKRKYNSKEAVLALIDEFKEATNSDEKNEELDGKLDFVLKSWLPKLTEKEADILMAYSLRKFFKFSAEDLREKYSTVKVEFAWTSLKGEPEAKRLIVDVWVPVDDRIYDLCSKRMKHEISKRVSSIAMGVKDKIDDLMTHPDLDKLVEFDIRGMDAVKHFAPELGNKVTLPLRKLLAKRYHEMNERSNLKKLTDVWGVRKFGDKIAQLVDAMAKL